MKRSEAFPSTYLRKEDLPRPHVAVIKAIGMEMFDEDDGSQREKPVCHFQNGTRPLVLRPTNYDTLLHAFGDDTDAWIGKSIELFVNPNIMMGRDRVGGIRIRIPSPTVDKPLSWDEAHALAAGVGLTRHELVAHLKKHGRTGYNSARDSALVHELVKQRRAESPLSNEREPGEDDVPF